MIKDLGGVQRTHRRLPSARPRDGCLRIRSYDRTHQVVFAWRPRAPKLPLQLLKRTPNALSPWRWELHLPAGSVAPSFLPLQLWSPGSRVTRGYPSCGRGFSFISPAAWEGAEREEPQPRIVSALWGAEPQATLELLQLRRERPAG